MEITNFTGAEINVDGECICMKRSPTQVRQVRPVVPPKKENLRIEGGTAEDAADELTAALKKLNLA